MSNNPLTDFASWAASSAPYLSPLTAPLAVVGSALRPREEQKPKAPAPSTAVGSEKDFGRLVGNKVYTGPNYGFQTVDTALTIPPEKASSNPAEQAEFRRVQQVLRANLPAATGAKPPQQEGPKPEEVDQRGPESTTETGSPTQPPAAQSTDPLVSVLVEAFKAEMDPTRSAERSRIDTENFIKRTLITNALAMRQTRENTKRQVELKNIEAWKALEQARIEANTRQAIATGQTVAAMTLPNQGLGQVLGQAYQASLAPFSNFALKG